MRDSPGVHSWGLFVPEAQSQPETADGIVYTDVAGAPGLRMFRCEVFSATLSTKGCTARWTQAQGGKPNAAARVVGATYVKGKHGQNIRNDEVLDKDSEPRDLLSGCRSCPIGAAHAGQVFVHHSWLFGMALCPRCRTGALRMIGDRICIGCYNREREYLRGRNGRGNLPTKLMLRPLHTVTYRARVDASGGLRRGERVIDMQESMIAALRRTKGALAFGFGGSQGMLRQGRLF